MRTMESASRVTSSKMVVVDVKDELSTHQGNLEVKDGVTHTDPKTTVQTFRFSIHSMPFRGTVLWSQPTPILLSHHAH